MSLDSVRLVLQPPTSTMRPRREKLLGVLMKMHALPIHCSTICPRPCYAGGVGGWGV